MWRVRHQDVLDRVIEAGLAAVEPVPLVRAAVTWEPDTLVLGGTRVPRRGLVGVHVVAAGKAARGMAQGALEALGDAVRVTGTVLTTAERGGGGRWPADASLPPLDVRGVRPPGWNRPTTRAETATRAVLRAVRDLGADDVLLVLLSGGGSALLAAPRAPLTLTAKVETIDRIDAAGAPIHLLNAVRRRLSDVKGGRLAAAAARARAVVGLLISDVADDDPAVLASGPLTGGPDEPVEERLRALGVLDAQPPAVHAALTGPLPAVAAPCHVLASPVTALGAMAWAAETSGLRVVDLGRVSGPVEDVVAAHVAAARAAVDDGPPTCLVSAGESTVALPPQPGRGSRLTHLAVALADALRSDRATAGRWSLGLRASDGEDAGLGDVGVAVDSRAFAHHVRRDGADVAAALRGCDTLPLAGRFLVRHARPAEARSNVQDLRVVVIGPASDDRERWEARHAVPGLRREGRPSRWLVEVTEHLPRAGRALDVACGDGGDVAHLAAHGLAVTGVDVAPAALAKARDLADERGVSDRVTLLEHDLTRGLPDLGAPFDVVAVTHYHDPVLLAELTDHVAPGGWMVVEVATTENLERGLPAPPERYLARPLELLFAARGLRVRVYREMEIDGMVRAQLLAQDTRPWEDPAEDDEGTDRDEG